MPDISTQHSGDVLDNDKVVIETAAGGKGHRLASLFVKASALAGLVRAVVMTGFSAQNSSVAATDTIVQAISKLQGQIDNLPSGGGSGDAWGDAVDTDILPDANGTHDIGSDTLRFAGGHFETLSVGGNAITEWSTPIVFSDITGLTNGVVVNNVVALPEADYQALATKDANTLYIRT